MNSLSQNVLRFTGANYDLPIVSSSGVLIQIIEIDNRLHVMLDIRDDTTHDDIREATRLALDWRDRLLDWQGPWNKGGPNELLERMHYYHIGGRFSYAELAQYLNAKIAARFNEPDGIDAARDALLSLRMSEIEVNELIVSATERIAEGLPPFEREYPISREKVISLLKDWRAKRKPDNDEIDGE